MLRCKLFCRTRQSNAENNPQSHPVFLENAKFRALSNPSGFSRLYCVWFHFHTVSIWPRNRSLPTLKWKKKKIPNNENIFLTKTRSPNSSITAEKKVQFWNLHIFISSPQLQLQACSFCLIVLTLMPSIVPCTLRWNLWTLLRVKGGRAFLLTSLNSGIHIWAVEHITEEVGVRLFYQWPLGLFSSVWTKS